MLYIVQFEDKPNMGELRDKLLQSHFDFLDRMKDRVLVPGSMREVPSDRPLGGLWIVEAADEAEPNPPLVLTAIVPKPVRLRLTGLSALNVPNRPVIASHICVCATLFCCIVNMAKP